MLVAKISTCTVTPLLNIYESWVTTALNSRANGTIGVTKALFAVSLSGNVILVAIIFCNVE